MTALTASDLTSANPAGAGIFDVLMRAVKAHLDEEFKRGAIKGPEYATVYMGSVNLSMQTGLNFLLQKQKIGLEVSLLEKQLLLAQVQVDKATIELAILTASQAKIPAEIAHLEAQTLLVGQQKANLTAEGLNIPKQGALIDGQTAKMLKDGQIADAEILIKAQEILVAQAEVAIATAKLANIPKEGAELDAKTLLITQQKTNLISENLGIVAKTTLTDSQIATETLRNFVHPTDPTLSGNFDMERQVLKAQQCKLTAEFDLTVSTTLKSAGEILLLAQKTATEKAQILSLGVDADSVVGKQKALYAAQTTGFTRDAEQKAAKLMTDTWSVRRTTDEATVADGVNVLNDVAVGRAVNKLLTGVGA